MEIRGKAWKFGDDVNTDVILPARYLTLSDPDLLAEHCMEDADPEFAGRVKSGELIVGGKNFGCGSSREHAPIAIKAVGISCVIAQSFARIFYRNAFNVGLPILECPEAAEAIEAGDDVEVDLEKGVIINHARQETFRAQPVPPFMHKLLQAGGLIPYVQGKMVRATP
jgi:3-isopropylmalate dehydratase small subunit